MNERIRRSRAAWTLSLLTCACAGAPPAQGPGADADATSPAEADPGPAPSTDPAIDTSPPAIWARFARDWNSGDPHKLIAWSPPAGVLVLDNPGAFVRVTRMESAPSLREQPGEFDGARIKKLTFSHVIDAGDVPQADCAKTPEVAFGTFLGETSGERVSKFIEALEQYDLASPEEVGQLRGTWASSSGSERFVVSDTKQSVAFYFGVEGSSVVLLAVDAVVPCSA